VQVIVGKGPENAQRIGNGLGIAQAPFVGEPPNPLLDPGDGLRIEQLTKLGLAKELGQERRVHGQGGGASFGEGRIALIEKRTYVGEEEGLGEW
jgi:hypothetical protein